MPNKIGKRLDITVGDDIGPTKKKAEKKKVSMKDRPYLGITFECCQIYSRIYINRDGTAYEGRCPRCMKPLKIEIGEGGTDCRFFRAD